MELLHNRHLGDRGKCLLQRDGRYGEREVEYDARFFLGVQHFYARSKCINEIERKQKETQMTGGMDQVV